MTALTKSERYIFYTNLLRIVCADPCVTRGFCYYLDVAAEASGEDIEKLYEDYIFDCDFIQFELPELFRIKPKDKEPYSYWFGQNKEGWQTRINKLHNIIQRM